MYDIDAEGKLIRTENPDVIVPPVERVNTGTSRTSSTDDSSATIIFHSQATIRPNAMSTPPARVHRTL